MDEQNKKEPYKLYVSYVDEDLELFKAFKKHLSLLQDNNLVKIWSKEDIKLGKRLLTERRKNIKEADIVLFLVSIELLVDPSIKNVEMKIALKRQMNSGDDVTIIPVLIRRCHWILSALAPFRPLPKNNVPVNMWADRDDALSEIVEAIHAIILEKNGDE